MIDRLVTQLQSGKLLHRPHIPMLKERNVRTGFFERDQFESVRSHLPAHLQPLNVLLHHRLALA